MFRSQELSSSLSAVAISAAVGSCEGSYKTLALVGADVPLAGEGGGAAAVLPFWKKSFLLIFFPKCLFKEEQFFCFPHVKPYMLHSHLWRTASQTNYLRKEVFFLNVRAISSCLVISQCSAVSSQTG